MQKLHDQCTVNGCAKEHHARGLCATHYAAFKRGVTQFFPIKTRVSVKPDHCLVSGCDDAVKSKGLCAKHYQRTLRHGHVKNIGRAKPFDECAVDGCTNHAYAKNVCHAHYVRNRLSKKYGITQADYLSMLESQKGVCKICGEPETSKDGISGKVKAMPIDHCHITGKVRGLLCSRCNRAIGMFADRIDFLQAAISYLQSHQKKSE